MTYFGVLAQFIGVPLVLLALWTWYDIRHGSVARTGLVGRWAFRVLVGHVALALIYTTPWDNYLVASGVWWYDENLVTGLTLGWVPIEEYVFFVVQTLLVSLLLLLFSRRVFPAHSPVRALPQLRLAALGVLGVLWLAAAGWLAGGWKPGTYLGLTLVWALVPLMIQLGFGADILWARRGLVAAAILVPGTYLCVVDALAIQSGTWTIDSAQSTGILLAGVLPIEEVIFFFATTTLVVFGMVLMLAEESQPRALAWAARLRASLRPGEPHELDHYQP